MGKCTLVTIKHASDIIEYRVDDKTRFWSVFDVLVLLTAILFQIVRVRQFRVYPEPLNANALRSISRRLSSSHCYFYISLPSAPVFSMASHNSSFRPFRTCNQSRVLPDRIHIGNASPWSTAGDTQGDPSDDSHTLLDTLRLSPIYTFAFHHGYCDE